MPKMRGHSSYENTNVCVPTAKPTDADTDMRSCTPAHIVTSSMQHVTSSITYAHGRRHGHASLHACRNPTHHVTSSIADASHRQLLTHHIINAHTHVTSPAATRYTAGVCLLHASILISTGLFCHLNRSLLTLAHTCGNTSLHSRIAPPCRAWGSRWGRVAVLAVGGQIAAVPSGVP